MKAVLLFELRRLFETDTGKTVVMEMDLYELPNVSATGELSTRYKFSWIAFDQESPSMRVLFDCHAPKGMHFHIDDEKEGQSFDCASISEAIQFFRAKVTERFGELRELPNDGGSEQ